MQNMVEFDRYKEKLSDRQAYARTHAHMYAALHLLSPFRAYQPDGG